MRSGTATYLTLTFDVKWFLKKHGVRVCTGFSRLSIGFHWCEESNELAGFG
jgi:hypothetical protein